MIAPAFSLAFGNCLPCHNDFSSQKGSAEEDCAAHSSEHVFVFYANLYLFISFFQSECCKSETFDRMRKYHFCQISIVCKAKCAEFGASQFNGDLL